MDIYVAQVTKTNLGADGRSIKVQSSMVPELPELVEPAFLGDIQLPPPVKDELVLVFNLDISNANRLYLPIRANLGALDSNGETKDSGKLQIENSTGDVEIHGDIVILGAGATTPVQPAVLGDTLAELLDAMLALMVAEVHPGPTGPVGVPVQAPGYQIVKDLLNTFKSNIVKLKKGI